MKKNEKIYNETNAAHHAAVWLVSNADEENLYKKYRLSKDKLYRKIYKRIISLLRDHELQLNAHSFQPICSFWQDGIILDNQFCKELFQECFFMKTKQPWSKQFVLYVSQYYVSIDDYRDIWVSKKASDGPSLF